MTTPRRRSAGSVLEDLRREVERSLLRGRNGIRYTAGVPVSVGQTPKETIWRRDAVEVWRYRRRGVTRRRPVLLVMSVVTRTYIFDLQPGDSIVESFLEAGFDVYLVDWGIPGEAESHNTLSTYVDGYLPLAIEAVCRESGRPSLDVLGYCLGGDFALLCKAANPEVPIESLALVATPVDFAAMGLPVSLIREGRLDPELLVDDTGNVPAGVILNSFRLRNPTAEVVQYANLLNQLWNDDYVRGFRALNRWIHDHIPFPGALARELVEVLVRQNRLAAGSLMIGGRRVRLKGVRCPILNVIATRDDVVPPKAAEALRGLVGSEDYAELRVDGGHVALVTGRLGHEQTIPGIIDWFERHQAEVRA